MLLNSEVSNTIAILFSCHYRWLSFCWINIIELCALWIGMIIIYWMPNKFCNWIGCTGVSLIELKCLLTLLPIRTYGFSCYVSNVVLWCLALMMAERQKNTLEVDVARNRSLPILETVTIACHYCHCRGFNGHGAKSLSHRNTKQNDSNYFQHLFMSAATKELPRAKLQVNLTSH